MNCGGTLQSSWGQIYQTRWQGTVLHWQKACLQREAHLCWCRHVLGIRQAVCLNIEVQTALSGTVILV